MEKYVKNKWNQISVKQFLSSAIKEEKNTRFTTSTSTSGGQKVENKLFVFFIYAREAGSRGKMENFNFSDIKIKEFSTTDELKQTEKFSSKKAKSSPRKSESACEGTSSLLLCVCVCVELFVISIFFPFFSDGVEHERKGRKILFVDTLEYRNCAVPIGALVCLPTRN